MKTLLSLLLFVPLFSHAQSFDTLKHLAVTWVIERNECRELLHLSEQEIVLLRASDSLNRAAADKYRSATDVLGRKVVELDAERKEAEADRDRWKNRARRRLWLLPVGVGVGVIIPLL